MRAPKKKPTYARQAKMTLASYEGQTVTLVQAVRWCAKNEANIVFGHTDGVVDVTIFVDSVPDPGYSPPLSAPSLEIAVEWAKRDIRNGRDRKRRGGGIDPLSRLGEL